MSDLMLLGVLRMPIDYVGGPLSPMAQLVSRAKEAADRIESDAEELHRLHAENEKLRARGAADLLEISHLVVQRNELLEALKIVRGKHGCGALELPAADLERVDAAIAKAEGEKT